MKLRTGGVFLFVLLAFLAGCTSASTANNAGETVMPATSKSATTSATISSEEAEKRIRLVQSNKEIPEDAKPGIIANIKHEAGLL